MLSLDDKTQMYLNDELNKVDMDMDVIKNAYLNHYPKDKLYDYPRFCLNKLEMYKSAETTNAIDSVKLFLEENPVINEQNIELFFNLDALTPSVFGLTGW